MIDTAPPHTDTLHLAMASRPHGVPLHFVALQCMRFDSLSSSPELVQLHCPFVQVP